MNKKDLVKTVSEATEMTQKATTEIVDAIFTAITDELTEGGEVSIPNFGKFVVKERPARSGRNPQTGETMGIDAYNAVSFKPSSVLKAAVK